MRPAYRAAVPVLASYFLKFCNASEVLHDLWEFVLEAPRNPEARASSVLGI